MIEQQKSGERSQGRASRKETLGSRVSAELREAILRGDFAPGAKINLDRVRETWDISVSSLREAMTRLIADGLVAFEDQRGYRVAPVSPENLAEVTTLRAALETMALGIAIDRGSLDWESGVLSALHRLNRLGRDSDPPESVERWEAAHAAFHLALVEGCEMPLLTRFCSILQNLNDRYRRIFPETQPVSRKVAEEHDAIARDAVARNKPAACDALARHIERTGKHLRVRLAAFQLDNAGAKSLTRW